MIGLIFGETNFPIEILKNIKKKNLKYLIIDLTKKKSFKKDKNCHIVSIGEFSSGTTSITAVLLEGPLSRRTSFKF